MDKHRQTDRHRQTERQTDRQKDMRKLIGTFRDYANAPKKNQNVPRLLKQHRFCGKVLRTRPFVLLFKSRFENEDEYASWRE
jgi:hypothetical protein